MNTNQRLGRNADGTTRPGFTYVAPGRTGARIVRRAADAIFARLAR
ncbi:hypothetical protein [Bauldia litoralis]